VILKGGAGIGKSEAMPPWEGVLDEEQTKSMVKLLRGFERAKK
jgi:mono/diheme cytochrome c family protein